MYAACSSCEWRAPASRDAHEATTRSELREWARKHERDNPDHVAHVVDDPSPPALSFRPRDLDGGRPKA